ncbi:MAG TPA: methyltransferase domain-containing protein, partial [Ktedonobacteraceae bacterium]|nr:methyltransferase domain-containing protein [Ktedonobacteraceae bacterium]
CEARTANDAPMIEEMKEAQTNPITQYASPFHIEDLEIFDDETLRVILSNCGFGLTVAKLARSLHGASESLTQRIARNLHSMQQHADFLYELHKPIPEEVVEASRCEVLQALFWELTYWKTPDLYEELIEGEQLHPGIFQHLEPDIRNKVVLDVGAGSGRATLECVRYGCSKIYAIEPSPGLLSILQQKIVCQTAPCYVLPLRGRFDKLPIADESVDTALACSAFTSDPVQGGEPGLAELRRVVKPGGKSIIIWPRTQDYEWFVEHSFCYVTLPVHEEMRIYFRTIESALRCVQRFYANNSKVVDYIVRERKPEIPFSMLGINPPCDYCWLEV